ncbi:MAG: AI-2E family transporter [Oscillospiraceae bacterium]|nr:AI-2E family transporter [Oscillospiraceae bacterium]MBR3536680.1 AI-2E family transporter [Oscillospiraceae bacterium]
MKIKFNEKYNTIAYYTVMVFAICILIVLLAFRFDSFLGIVGSIFKAISPVIWGFVIAYIMQPLVRTIERFLTIRILKKKKQSKLCRSVSIIIASLIGFSAIIALVAMAVPQIVESISTLLNKMPDYLYSLYVSTLDFLEKNPEINEQVTDWFQQQYVTISDHVLGWITDIKPAFERYFVLIKDGVFSFLMGIKDFLLGYIVSIYLLYSKENFIRQAKKFFYAVLPKSAYDTVMVKGAHANTIFSDFLVGKSLDSFVIGMLCFIVMVIFQFDNAMLISFIVGITNMIPFFGPFIGAIPSIVLVLLTQPQKTVVFIIIILVLQQFDGNILGPKILGNKLNLPTFWIMFSIFFFGNLFGFGGMLAGVPVFAVIYTLTKEFVDERIRIKNLEMLKKGITESDREMLSDFEDEES